jgi:hypothetical protein
MLPVACEEGYGVSVVWGGCCGCGFVVGRWLGGVITRLGPVQGRVEGWVLWVCLWEVLMVW